MLRTVRHRQPITRADEQAYLHFALTRLQVRWRQLQRPELEVLMRHLLMAEHRCVLNLGGTGAPPTNRWLLPRLRRRRMAVARRLVARGGRVSPMAMGHALPSGTAWPGIAALVGRQVWAPADRRSAVRAPRPAPPSSTSGAASTSPGAAATSNNARLAA